MTDTSTAPLHKVALWRYPLVLMRLLAMLAMLLLLLPMYYLAHPVTAHNPVPRWFLRSITAIIGVKLRRHGNLPAQDDCFLLANHVSWIDILALGGTTGTAFVAHDGLAQIGPLRWLCSLNDTVFIARHDKRTIANQVRDMAKALQETGRITLFPEGTTTTARKPAAFKSSLLSIFQGDFGGRTPKAIPVWLDYGLDVEEVAWADGESGIQNALRILGRVRPVELTLHFLSPLHSEETADRKRMANAALTAIVTASID